MAAGRGPSEAIEDYAKAIYSLCRQGDGTATTNALAERLGVTPASVSAMVKKLDERGLVRHVRYKGVALTPDGERVALEVMRHHRLLETYLAEHLGVPWDRVHEEAEALEHVLSEYLEAKIAAKLGHPDARSARRPDPVGRPRDLRGGRHRACRRSSPATAACSSASPTPTPRCSATWTSAASRWATSCEVLERQPFDGPLTVRFGEAEHVLGGTLAGRANAIAHRTFARYPRVVCWSYERSRSPTASTA